MSCRLDLRVVTPKDWKWSFRTTIRDLLKNKGCLGSEDAQYLRGLMDATNSKEDAKQLEEIIDAIENGHTIEMRLVC
jgi:hypothetical protein